MGSIDSGSSSPPNPSSSLNGLKFGRKIYFEDAAGSTSSTPRRVRGGGGGGSPNQGGTQPPRCQVEGCNVDLRDAKAYYSRHKVCGMHSKSSQVTVSGMEQRFCQQCSRFHQLSEFDQGKRSCRRRLAGHNERRRKPPPGSLFSPRFGRLPSSIFENGTRSGSFIMDFTRDAWLSAQSTDNTGHVKFLMHQDHRNHHPWQGSSENPPPSMAEQQQASSETAFSSPVECYTAGGSVVGATTMDLSSSSSCALSLLSNQPQPQPWVSRSDHNMSHPYHGVSSWVPPDLGQGQGQFLQTLNGHHFSVEVADLSQQGRRQYMEELHHCSSHHHPMEYWPL